MRFFFSKVVICFQIVSLTYWKTTPYFSIHDQWQLWFAFKLYLWRIEKQHGSHLKFFAESCDLLSNCIFDVLKNNVWDVWPCLWPVVICFQIVSLTYWKTTATLVLPMATWLWFAFKLYLWRIEKQHGSHLKFFAESCDLLSNCIFDVLKNNIRKF